MKIRRRLAWIFVLLTMAGVMFIISFSILFIRFYLRDKGIEDLKAHSLSLQTDFSIQPSDSCLMAHMIFASRELDVSIIVFQDDSTGSRLYMQHHGKTPITETKGYKMSPISPAGDMQIKKDENDVVIQLPLHSGMHQASRFQIIQSYDSMLQPLHKIRWIIYKGLFISLGLIAIVSFLYSRYLTQDINRLKEIAANIAEGNFESRLDLNRDDEFGNIAASLNTMAANLYQDNVRLKESNEKQKQFYADITHELRNPLQAVLGSLEMLSLPKIKAAKRKQLIDTAVKQAERINRLFTDLITLQRFDSDENFIRNTDFDLAKVCHKIMSIHQHLNNNKKLKFEVHNCNYMVHADEYRIEQVIENLVHNAVKYTEEGVVKICSETDGEGWLRIDVIDTGIGIKKEHIPLLTDRFYRTDTARSRDKGGTGLGLAVVKSILSACHSDLYISSEEGAGSRFSFYLPLIKTETT